MRCYQHIGLKPEAEEFLEENTNKIPSTVCPKCQEILSWKLDRELYDHEDLFYGDGPDLHTYRLKDGRIAKEVLQCNPMSSGPVGFLCLEIEGKRLFEWTEKEIYEYL